MPPGFQNLGLPCWEDLDCWQQAKVLAFHQTKEHDENDHGSGLASKPKHPQSGPKKVPKKRRR